MKIQNRALFYIILAYIIVQTIYVTFFHLPFKSDSLMFFNFAQQSIAIGRLYPNIAMLNADYIVSPVYVNYNYFLLSIINSPFIILCFNILLNTLQLFLIYKITEKIFEKKSAFIACVIYMLYLTNLGLVLENLSELLFGVLIFSSILLYLSKDNFYYSLFNGIIIGLAFGVRPIALAVILAYIIIFFIELYRKNNPNLKKLFYILIGTLLYITIMGSISKKNIGYFISTAGTGQINLALSSNNSANGIYNDSIFKNDSIYNSKKTFVEKNSYLLNKSMKWIKKHPFKYFTTIPRKVYSTFISDDWTVSQLTHTEYWNFDKFIKSFRNEKLRIEFKNEPIGFRIFFITINIFNQLFYMSILLLVLYQFLFYYKNNNININVILLYIIFLLGYVMTFVISVGTPRYKYPFILIGIILIAPVIKHFYQKFFRIKTYS